MTNEPAEVPCHICSRVEPGSPTVACAGCNALFHDACFRRIGRCACGSAVARTVSVTTHRWLAAAHALRENGGLILFIAAGLAALELVRRFLVSL